jgi:hypothetical protein
MQKALNTVQRWRTAWESSLNPDALEHILLVKRQNGDRFIESVLLNGVIRPSGSVKYLEVILDVKVTWREHVKAKNWYSLLSLLGTSSDPRQSSGSSTLSCVLALYWYSKAHCFVCSKNWPGHGQR